MRDQDQEAPGKELPEPPSKTKIKQAMLALQDLGGELVKLPQAKLEKLPLPDELRRAVEDYRRFTKNGAIRRQMQYIGRLMRGIDPEPIARQLAAWRGDSDEEKALLHRIERWRDRLIEHDDALTDFLRDYPDADATQLRQLIRNACHEAAQNKPPKSSRALFRLIREVLEPGTQQENY
jgi:ribosome-associated protein